MTKIDSLIPLAKAVVATHGGVAPLRAFAEVGITGTQVAALRHRGVIDRARVGWYADPGLSPQALEAVRVGGVLGCTSAAAAWGIATPERAGELLEVSIPRGTTRLRFAKDSTRRARAGQDTHVRWHWEQRHQPAGAWRVSVIDAILQMAACVSWRWLVAAIDSARCDAERPALLSESDLAELRAALPERLRSAVDRSDPRCQTSGETFVRLELEDRGIPYVPQQWWTTGFHPDGTVDGWLPIEIDGMSTHSGREAGERDRERDGTIAQFGMHPLRFSQTKAVRETAWVGDVIEAAWRRGCPPGFRRSDRPSAA